MCNLFNEAADLAEDCAEKYEKVMGRVRELKIELIESSVVCGSNVFFDTPNASLSLGDVAIPSKESRNIFDPKAVTRKGRLPTTRKQGVEKMSKKKREQKHKTKEVEKNVDGNVFGTQESVVNINSYQNYMSQFMWPNMMPQFSPSLCPTRTIFPNSPIQFINILNFPRARIPDTQVWGAESSLFDTEGQGSGGELS
ncbi:uncharacterized protein LOC130769233 [Actinidia eriantha]|uniref:uncharacterized protein LOC130769233 n=1 Tax=Actinidia eriantha TaxID=165200 RepID=UPI00258823E7|nr:uncharacterized protein LOC130769233 [Actinidia eriantha]